MLLFEVISVSFELSNSVSCKEFSDCIGQGKNSFFFFLIFFGKVFILDFQFGKVTNKGVNGLVLIF